METASNINASSEEKEQNQQSNSSITISSANTNNGNISKEFNILVDKVYSKILDLAKDKNIFQLNLSNNCSSHPGNINNNNNSNYEGVEYEVSMEEENQRAYAPQNILTSNTILYGILKHTCLNCSKSYEQAKCLRRHFILEHIVNKPTYICSHCVGEHSSIYELDKYLQHLLTKHNTLNDLETVYDLFILKYTQDVFCDYFVEGRFYLDPQQLKHINKLKFGKENCTLIQKMHSKIYENYFICDDEANLCKPPITLTSKSIKSNLLYSQITKANVFKEIIEYFRINPNLMNDDALNAYTAIQNITTMQQNENTSSRYQIDNCKYNQCKFCMKIFRECNAYKEHVMEVHTFNEFCNRCVVCPYCKQLLKSNFDKNVDANALLNVHIKKCIALKSDFTYVFNSFKTNNNNNNNGVSVNKSNSASSTIQNEYTAPPPPPPPQQQQQQQHGQSNKVKKRDENLSDLLSSTTTETRKKQKLNNSVTTNSASNGVPFKNRKTCYLCNYTADTNIDKHIFEEHIMIRCMLCDKDIIKNRLTEHLNQVHIPDSTEICYSCSFLVSDECKHHLELNEFFEHKCINEKLNDYKNNFKCPICNERLINNENETDADLNKLKAHFQQSHSKAVFNCELCTASFRNSWCLTEHILFEHKNDVTTESTNNNNNNVQLQCFKCFKIINFKNENDLKLHETNDNCVKSTDVPIAVDVEVLNQNKDTTIIPQEEILMETVTVETIIEPTAQLPIVNRHHQLHNGSEDEISNSNLYFNPLSILSNVSTTVPHILSVDTTSNVNEEVIENKEAETDSNHAVLQSDEAIAKTNNDELMVIKFENTDAYDSNEHKNNE